MINSIFKIKNLKIEFSQDRLGFVLKYIAIFFAFLVIFTLPSFTFRTGFNLLSILFSVLFVTFAIIYILFRGEFRFCWLIVPYLVFVLYCALSYVFTKYSFLTLRTLCLVYGLMFVVFEFSVNIKNPRLILDFFLWSTILLAFLIFVDNYQEILSFDTERIGSKYGNLNEIGWIFACGFFFALYRILFLKKRFVISTIFGLVDFAFAVLTGSRGAVVLIVTSALVFLFFFFKGKKKLYFFIACLIVLVGVFLILQIPSFAELRERLMQTIESLLSGGASGDASSGSRFLMFKEGVYLFSQSPIFGNGLDSFSVLSNQNVYSHANLSEMLCDFGLVGLSIWLAPLIYCSYLELKNKRSPLCLIYSVALILPSMFFSIIYNGRFFAISAAICISFIACEENEIPGIYLRFFPKPSIWIKVSESSCINPRGIMS